MYSACGRKVSRYCSTLNTLYTNGTHFNDMTSRGRYNLGSFGLTWRRLAYPVLCNLAPVFAFMSFFILASVSQNGH